jgi:Fusaric acid resistance protein-like
MTTSFPWKRLAQLGPFRWSNAAPQRAGRAALGVVAPLVLGLIAGRVDYGAYAALGALPAGFVSFQGESRTRVTAVLVASVGMALSTYVGAVAAALSPWLLVPVIALWGYVTGLAVSLGQRYSVAVLQWSIALLIAAGLPFGPADAALRALLVLAGGWLQAALVAASWTLSPGSSERTALASSYRSLATYASDLAGGGSEAPPPTAFPAGTALDDPNPLLPTAARLVLVDLLEEAERIRASLAALATQGADAQSAQPGEIRALMSSSAGLLTLIADAIGADRTERAVLMSDFHERISRVAVPAGAAWQWAGEALLGQLRAVGHIVADFEGTPARDVEGGARAVRSRGWWQGSIAAIFVTLRANATTTSEAGRHALRLAVIAALAEVVVQITGLYQGRWVILTIFIVLKPDFGTTVYRGVQRGLGTMLGAGLGAVAAQSLHTGPGGLVALTGVCVAAAYAVFDVSFLLTSLSITAFLVMLLDLLGSPVIRTAEARLLDTFIGATLALGAYLAWPTWEGASAQEKFARMLTAHREYATALLQQLIHPGSAGASQLRALQGAARSARSDAEAATARLREEPPHPPLTPEVAQTLIAGVARLAQSELALHALVLSRRGTMDSSGALDRLAERINAFAAALGAAIDHLASSVLRLQQPEAIPALRPLQSALRADPQIRDSAVVGITDRLVDAVNTLDSILRTRLPAAGLAEPARIVD